MTATRRDFVRLAALAAPALGLGSSSLFGADPPAAGKGGGKTLLILGGTGFLGPALVEAAKAAGYTITLFNRGKTNPHLFPELEKLHGDRKTPEGLKVLENRAWDAVVDTSGYVPKHVRMSAELLKDKVKQYVFISSISVYADNSKPDMDETAAVGKIADETVEQVTGETYGPLKALCEQAAEKALPGRTLNIRPGLIVGPGDPTDRFTYWPVRVARGGEVLAPGAPTDPVLVIDVRDLAAWTIRMVDARKNGLYNATGPAGRLSIGELLEACKRASGSDARFTFADADFLEKQQVSAWQDMPVWVPPVGEYAGMGLVSRARAVKDGLTFRPLEATAKDTLAWWNTLPEERRTKPLKAGLTAEREAAVLKTWHEQQAELQKKD